MCEQPLQVSTTNENTESAVVCIMLVVCCATCVCVFSGLGLKVRGICYVVSLCVVCATWYLLVLLVVLVVAPIVCETLI